MAENKLKPVHPGEVLLEEFLKPMGLSQNHLALGIGVPPRRINEIVLGKRSIPPMLWRAGWNGKLSPTDWLLRKFELVLVLTLGVGLFFL